MKLCSPAFLVPCIALVVSQTGPSQAAPPSGGGKAREFVVEGDKTAVDVVVAPAYVTVFYLPDPVKKAIASDQSNFSISVMENTVTVRPVKTAVKTANLNIDTATVHVSVILRVGGEEEAASQVTFVRASDKQVLEERVAAEVERRLAPLRAALETKQRSMEAAIRDRANDEIARRILRRYVARDLDGIGRTNEHVVVRVKRALLVGEDAILWYDLQNRGDAAYELQVIEATQGGLALPSRAYFERPPADGTRLGAVAAGQRASGLVVIPITKLAARKPVELRFLDASGKALTIDRLFLDGNKE